MESGDDITGKCQHSFNPKKSKATASLTLQSVLSHALDNNNHSVMSDSSTIQGSRLGPI